MCLIAFALEPSSRFRFVLAANRDEFHDRPAAPAHWWASDPGVYAGRDMLAGGTWLGVNRAGRAAALTNFRDRPLRGSGSRSRGELAAAYLGSGTALHHYAQSVAGSFQEFGGFNLLLFEFDRPTAQCVYLSNRTTNEAPQTLTSGVHGLSNHLLNTPWPKVRRLQSAMKASLELTDPTEALLAALTDRSAIAADEVSAEAGESEPLTRTPFIADARYGTRASTVLSVDHGGHVIFVERSWGWSQNAPCLLGERRVRFEL